MERILEINLKDRLQIQNRIDSSELEYLAGISDGSIFPFRGRTVEMTTRMKHEATALICIRNLELLCLP